MTSRIAVTGARIFDGENWHDEAALVLAGGRVEAVLPHAELPEGLERVEAGGKLLVPGFIDLQVNGGGGILLNDAPTVEGIARICAAHARFGTTALLATLISDTPEVTARALEAGGQARREHVPGFLGLHLEGPHIAPARKGCHEPGLIRAMEEADLDMITAGRGELDVLMLTVAPEQVAPAQVARLAASGCIVSLGHTDADYETAKAYVAAGASCVTHIFNAMSPLAHRQPGLVGAALDIGGLHVGLIADGIHVVPAALGVALRAKPGPGKFFVVTDAMAPLGTDDAGFRLHGREILRRDGRLTLVDGTLAGADIDMAASIRFLHRIIGLPLEEVLRMASVHPAEAARVGDRKGALKPGFDADFVLLDDALTVTGTWIGGAKVYQKR